MTIFVLKDFVDNADLSKQYLASEKKLALKQSAKEFIGRALSGLSNHYLRQLTFFQTDITRMNTSHTLLLIKSLKHMLCLKIFALRSISFLERIIPTLYISLKDRPFELERINIWTLYAYRHKYDNLSLSYYFASRIALNCCKLFETQTDSKEMPRSAKYFFEAAEKKGRTTDKYTFAIGRSHTNPPDLFEMCKNNISVFRVQDMPDMKDRFKLP